MSKLFDQSLRTASARHRAVVRRHELIHTVAEFVISLASVIGSALVLVDGLTVSGAWVLLCVSVLLAIRPTSRLLLELHLFLLPLDPPAPAHATLRTNEKHP